MNIKQKLQALISAANETTGETATDVTEAVQALVDGYGGIFPSGTKQITDTALTDVSTYANAQVVDANLVADNIKKDVSVLGVTGTYEGGSSVDAAFVKKTQYYNYTSGSFYLFRYTDLISAGILTESTRNIKDLWNTCTLMVYSSYITGAPSQNVGVANKVLNLMMQYPCATYGDAGDCYCGNIEYTTSTGTSHSAARQSGEWINVNSGDFAWIDADGSVNLKASSSRGYIYNYTAYLICTGRKTTT